MAEYIDRKRTVAFVKKYSPQINGMTTLKCVERAIKEIPASDVVEVVRCKECRYSEDFGMSGIYCNHPDNRNPLGCRPNDFCNDGERKGDCNNCNNHSNERKGGEG